MLGKDVDVVGLRMLSWSNNIQNKLDDYEKQLLELNHLGEKMGYEFNEKVTWHDDT